MTSAPVFLADAGPIAAAGVGDLLDLGGAEGRHAVAVRRLRPGEPIVLTDGLGRAAAGVVAELRGKDALLVEVRELRVEPPPAPRLTVVQALPKGDRGELAVELLSEVGADAVVPWQAARCVTRWRDERGAKALARWRAAAREAGKQARRARFVEVAEPAGTEAVARLLAGAALPAVLHEEAEAPLAGLVVPADGEVVLVVGPEGGIAPEELAAFAAVGAGVHRLGPSVLRTSTTGAAAAAVLLARAGRWG